MQDLYLDPETHDLVISGYAISLIDENARVRQQIKQRLLHFTREWFLNLQSGTPWIESILVKDANQTTVSAILKARIRQTPGVEALQSFSIAESGERGLAIQFSVSTVYNGTVSDQVQVSV